ncbi:MAG: WG repeat-containing protein [Clostridia bacterium]
MENSSVNSNENNKSFNEGQFSKQKQEVGQKIAVDGSTESFNGNRQRNNFKSKNFKKRAKVDDYVPSGDKAVLDMPVEQLKISDLTKSALLAGGIKTVYDIVKCRMTEMYHIQNIGKRNCFEIRRAINPLKVDFREEKVEDMPARSFNNNTNSANNSANGNANNSANGNANFNGNRNNINNGKKDFANNGGNQRQNNHNQTINGARQNNPNQHINAARQNNPNNSGARQNNKNNNAGARQNNPNQNNNAGARQQPVQPPQKRDWEKFFRKGKYGFKDPQGKEAIAPTYDEAFGFKEELACVELNGLLGFINKQNEMIIPCIYDVANSFSGGFANVTKDSKSGYINKEGEVVIPLEFDAATPFWDGKAWVNKDGKWGAILAENLTEIKWR